MGVRVAGPLSIVLLCVGVGLGACIDLFHTTGDLRTACQVDASISACMPETDGARASSDAGAPTTDFCSWTPDRARQNAEHACAWLGACETPMGGNAVGSCMFEALLAFNCAANPNHRVKGKTLGRWDCLWRAQSCGEVDRCIFPDGAQLCDRDAGDHTSCGSSIGAPVANLDVRVACSDAGIAHGENCALWGQTCASDGMAGVCSSGPDVLGCAEYGCFGPSATQLHWCAVDGGRVGIDCAANGAQQCAAFPTSSSPQWVACTAESDAGAAARCAPDASATCTDAGYAVSCPSGVLEKLDCSSLLSAVNACVQGPLSPPFDWRSACAATSAACSTEACAGKALVGCSRGATFTIDCTRQELGLGPCHMVTVPTLTGTEARPACGRP
jgi:hypothetical protein